MRATTGSLFTVLTVLLVRDVCGSSPYSNGTANATTSSNTTSLYTRTSRTAELSSSRLTTTVSPASTSKSTASTSSSNPGSYTNGTASISSSSAESSTKTANGLGSYILHGLGAGPSSEISTSPSVASYRSSTLDPTYPATTASSSNFTLAAQNVSVGPSTSSDTSSAAASASIVSTSSATSFVNGSTPASGFYLTYGSTRSGLKYPIAFTDISYAPANATRSNMPSPAANTLSTSWHGANTAPTKHVTGTGTGSWNASITAAPKWRNGSTSIPSGFAVYDNATFRTNCPSMASYLSNDCYPVCEDYAASCQASWYTWSTSNQFFQITMQSLHGDKSTAFTTLTDIEAPATWYTDIMTQLVQTEYITITGYTSTETYYHQREICLSSSTVYGGTEPLNTVGINTCGTATEWTTQYPLYIITATTSTLDVTATYLVTSSAVSTNALKTLTKYTEFEDSSYPFSIPPPSCTFTQCQQPANCHQCTISGGTVQLLYWPVPTSTSQSNGSYANTTTAAPSLVSAVVDGVTITSPSVAISFQAAWAVNDCGQYVGKNETGSIIVLDPGDVSTAIGAGGDPVYDVPPGSTLTLTGSHYTSTVTGLFQLGNAVNYADYNWPYPLSAWLNQPRCNIGGCGGEPIISGQLRPQLLVPSQIRQLDTLWQTCALDWVGLYDPPTTLAPASVVAAPTVSFTTTPTPAAPSPTPTSPATSTSVPPARPQSVSSSIPAPTASAPNPGSLSSSASPSTVPETVTSKTQTSEPVLAPSSTTQSAAAPANPSPQSSPEAHTSETTLLPSSSEDPTAAPTPSPNDPNNPTSADQQATHSVNTNSPVATVGEGPTAVTIIPGSSSGQVIASSGSGQTTLNPGDSTTINNTPVSVDSTGNVVVGVSTTVNVPAPAPESTSDVPVTVIGSNTVQVNPSGSGVVIGSGTFVGPGQATTLDDGSGATVSVNNQNSIVVTNGGSTTTIAASGQASSGAGQLNTVIGSNTVQATSSGSAVVINGDTTLSQGQGTTLDNGSGATVLVNEGAVIIANSGSATTAALLSPASSPILAGGQTVSSVSNGIVIGGLSTISAGGDAATISNIVYSVASNGGLVVASSSTGTNPAVGTPNAVSILSQAEVSALASSGVVVTGSNGQVYTAIDPSGNVVIGSVTVSDGQTTTIQGLGTVVAASSGLVVSGQTQLYSPLPTPTPEQTGAVFTAGGVTYTALQPSGTSTDVIVEGDGTTFSLAPSATISINGQVVSAAPSGSVVVGGHTLTYSNIAPVSSETGAVFTAGGQTYTTLQPSEGAQTIIVEGASTTFGIAQGAATTLDGELFSAVPSDGVVVGSQTLQYSAIATGPVLTPVATFVADGTTYTASEPSGSSTAVLDGSTLSLGGSPITIGSQTISLAPSGLVIVSNGQTSTASFNTNAANGPVITEATFVAGATTYTVSEVNGPNTAEIDGSMLAGGGPAATIASQTISLSPSGLIFESDGRSSTASFFTTSADPALITDATFVVNGRTYTAVQTGGPGTALMAGTVLSQGGPAVTIDGEIVSLASNGLVLASAGSTNTEAFSTTRLPSSPVIEVEAVLTAGAQTLTAFQVAGSSGVVEVDGMTLSAGGPDITISGEVISVASNGIVTHTSGEAGSATLAFSTVTLTPTGSEGLGYVASGLGPWGAVGSSPGITATAASGTGTDGRRPQATSTSGAGHRESFVTAVVVLFVCFWGSLLMVSW